MWPFAKSNVILPSECKKLIFLNALFQGGRLFVGAICVLYFISSGLEAQDYAWIKTAQVLVFIGLDIPFGYFLSRFGEYRSLLLSLILGALGSFGYIFASSFEGFLFSEVLLALSLSSWPVAMSAYSMLVLEKYKVEGIVEKHFHFGDAISSVAILICGSLGGILYYYDKHIPYIAFFVLYLTAILYAFFFIRDYGESKPRQIESYLGFVSNVRESLSLFSVASVLFVVQFFMQPLLHYWQPLFLSEFNVSSKDMSIIFIAYSISMSLCSWFYSNMTHLTITRTQIFIQLLGFLGGVSLFFITNFNHFSLSIAFFSLCMGLLNLVQVGGGVFLQKFLTKENRMIMTKYISFYSRLGMIASLMFLHSLFKFGWEIVDIYKLYGIFLMITFFTVIAFNRFKEKKIIYGS